MISREAPHTMSRVNRSSDRPKKPLVRSARLWVPVTLGVLLLAIIGIGIAGWQIAERGFAAKDELEQAIPLAQKAQEQVLAGDTEGAAATVDELAVHATEARRLTDNHLAIVRQECRDAAHDFVWGKYRRA